MNARDQQIADELRNINVTKDAYELWLQNDVTRMFRLQMECEYLDLTLRTINKFGSSTMEQIAMAELVRSANVECLESVLDWSPDFGQDE